MKDEDTENEGSVVLIVFLFFWQLVLRFCFGIFHCYAESAIVTE